MSQPSYPLKLTVAVAFLCGCGMQTVFSPFDWWWLGILLPTMVLWLARQQRAFVHGYAFGIGWFGVGSWWLTETFHVYGGLPYIAGVAIVALIGAVLGLFPALWFAISQRLARSDAALLYVFPATVVLMEWLRGHLFTGLPWVAWGNSLLDTPAAAWASYVGVYGLAAWPAAAVVASYLALQRSRLALLAIPVVVLLWCFAPASVMVDRTEQHAALIQGNIAQDQKWDAEFLQSILDTYTRLSARFAAQADVIIWPESAVPFFPSRLPDWDQWLQQQMQNWHTPVLYGGDRLLEGDGDQAQTGLYAWQDGQRSFSGKQHLVPFGEYVPTWLPFIHTLIPAIANFRPAEGDGVLHAGGSTFGTLICYESIFPEEARHRVLHGAQVLVVASNDAWYGRSPAVWQHTQAARMRAVETGRYLLRVGNTGITAAIDQQGRITAQLPWWQADGLRVAFHRNDAITPYVRWGDWPMLLLAMLLLSVAFVRTKGTKLVAARL